MAEQPPCVLTIAAHDPGGGAGIQADWESIIAHRGRAVSLISGLTAQSINECDRPRPQRAVDLLRQGRLLLQDVQPQAIKVGVVISASLVPVIATLADECGNPPLVLDPVLASSSGRALVQRGVTNALWRYLLPKTTVITPNLAEALTLTRQTKEHRAAEKLLSQGVSVLITDTQPRSKQVINRLYTQDGTQSEHTQQRLAGHYHGSGCTLASALATQLAYGFPLPEAVATACAYTRQALRHSYTPQRKKIKHPHRLYTLWN